MKGWPDQYFDMPDKVVAVLIRPLDQGKGQLSSLARKKEFAALKDNEISAIEEKYSEMLNG